MDPANTPVTMMTVDTSTFLHQEEPESHEPKSCSHDEAGEGMVCIFCAHLSRIHRYPVVHLANQAVGSQAVNWS